MQALLVVDAQNEFSENGQRAVSNHTHALSVIRKYVEWARESSVPIAWIQHHNKPNESPAFVPGSWGAELSPGFEPEFGSSIECLIQKDVFGAFTGTELETWLRGLGVTEVIVTGFYTHMCVSTTVREALVRGFEVIVDYDATGTRGLTHRLLGAQSADEVRRSALLQLTNMGATIRRSEAGDARAGSRGYSHRVEITS